MVRPANGKNIGEHENSGSMAARISEHPYIELINKIQMEATAAKISGTALFNNEAKGFDEQITMRSILTNYIYPNTLAVLRVTGSDLKAALERTAEHLEINDEEKLFLVLALLNLNLSIIIMICMKALIILLI